jgi:hypothetical protein
MFRADFPSCAVQLRNDTVVGAHFGRAGQGSKTDPRRVSRLVGRTAVGEGWGARRLTQLAQGGGEGGEGLYIARSGRRTDLLVSPRGGGG